MIEKLTALTVEKVRQPGYYGDGGGLYLRIAEGGTKSWVYRFRAENGRTREMGLGSLDTWGLKEARQRARKCRQQRAEGVDPIEARRERRARVRLAAAKVMTFRQCAEAYIAAHAAGWKNPKHAAQWPSTLASYVYPVIGALAVQAVDTGLVMRCLEPIWHDKPETAGRVRGRIEAVLDWAAARGHRQGENPGRWKGHLENLLPAKSKVQRVEHHAALPYAEINTFLAELRRQDGIAALAFEFAILTAARTGEVLGARWEEIAPGERLWTIPAARMKAGREHRAPLSDAALAIVARLAAIRSCAFVFPGLLRGRPLSQMAMLMLLRRMGRGELTVHGFRSSFSDWCAEQTNYPSEVRRNGAGAHRRR